MLANGYRHAWFSGRVLDDPIPAPPVVPSAPVRFVPQKAIAIRRARIVVVVVGLAVLGALASLL
jgi:hypothetical protein